MNKKSFIYTILIILFLICFSTGYILGNKSSMETQRKIEEMKNKD